MIHFRPNLPLLFLKQKGAIHPLQRYYAKKYPYSGNEATNSKDSTKNPKKTMNTVYSVIMRL